MKRTLSSGIRTLVQYQSVDAGTEWSKKHHFYFSYLVGSSDEMGYHGARALCFRLLRQATHSLSYGETIYSEDGPQQPRISREFFDSKVGPLESPTFRVPFSHHIPGVQNVVADRLTRFMSLSSMEIPASKRHLFIEDRIPRIFRFGGEGMVIAEKPGDIEGDDKEGSLGLENLGEVEKRGIFARYSDSIVEHLGVDRTLKALSLRGHG